MKKTKKINIFMIFVVALQIVLGLALVFGSLYLDEYVYLSLEGFFFHFMHVPGATMIIMTLHYLFFYKYKTIGNFVFTGIICCFIIANTGECLFLFIDMFPEGWINYIIWFVICEIAVCIVVGAFHLLFAFILGKFRQKSKEA